MKSSICFVLALVTLGSCSKVDKAQSTDSIFLVLNAGISDHSDPSVTGSLAWYLNEYGGGSQANPHTFVLTASELYHCKNRIVIPSYAKITSDGESKAVLMCDPDDWQADPDLEFIRMTSGTSLFNIEVRCNWMPIKGIFMDNADQVEIIDVIVHKSRKAEQSHLISMKASSNVVVRDCLLRRAGCDTDETNFSRRGYLIHIDAGGDNILIKHTDMALAPSSGIGFTTATNVTIDSNHIRYTGMALIAGFLSDGITNYHNQHLTGDVDRNIRITNNTIRDSHNHGIHVSGRGFHIENNLIYDSGLSTLASHIYLGDYKSPRDCTSESTIINNVFKNGNGADNCPVMGGKSIKVEHYDPSSVLISGNSGCLTTELLDPSCT